MKPERRLTLMTPTLPTIETDHMSLRPLKVEDAHNYHALETDPEVKQFLGGPSTRSVSYYESMTANGWAAVPTTLAVTLAESGNFVGRCGFTRYHQGSEAPEWEIDIVLGRQLPRNRGYATEIGLALISHGFDVLSCSTILGVVDASNIAAISLCKRLRMTHRKDTIRYGRRTHIYAIAQMPHF